MDRRSFLSSLIGGIVTTAAVRTFPFRVFSFPTEIKSQALPFTLIREYDVSKDSMISKMDSLYGWSLPKDEFTENYLKPATRNLVSEIDSSILKYYDSPRVVSTLSVSGPIIC